MIIIDDREGNYTFEGVEFTCMWDGSVHGYRCDYQGDEDEDDVSREEIEDMVVRRQNFRQQKDYTQADELQTKLKDMMIELDKEGGWRHKSGNFLFSSLSLSLSLCTTSLFPSSLLFSHGSLGFPTLPHRCHARVARSDVCTHPCPSVSVTWGRWPWRPRRVQPTHTRLGHC